jgi:hypothetical protein
MKNLIGNLRMRTKLMVAPLICIFFLVLLAMVSYKCLSDQKRAIDDLQMFGSKPIKILPR